MLPVRIRLESTISSLLEKALPNDFQKFKIYKHFVRYYEYKGDYFAFCSKLFEFYEMPKKKRCDKKANRLFNIELSQYDYQILGLGFHNSLIQHHEIFSKATDIKWLMTENFKLPDQIATAEIFFASLVYFNKPSNDKNYLIECEDFLDSWKQVCFTRFGNKFEKYIEEIYPLISKENSTLDLNVQAIGCVDAGNTVQLTQTQIDWVEKIEKNIEKGIELPLYRGPRQIENPKLRHLNHHVIAFNKLIKSAQHNLTPQMQLLVDSLAAICKELLGPGRKENVWNATIKSQES
ncbi:hypothetical protein CIK05_11880 [Bdellovibrio sp. qaytius]|nr:hypothetical protein CIK05_11880 [Bdellovibrio sp. qaytius]